MILGQSRYQGVSGDVGFRLHVVRPVPAVLALTLYTMCCCLSSALAVETISADSIRPGMKGYGLSVFSGYEVERFEVEVVDVMRNVSPRRDMILGRLSGAGLERSGVIAGMSGSPVYIEGKLAGAVAYAWGFSKEPLAGITPINEMLDIWNLPAGTPGTGIEKRSSNDPPALSPLLVPVALSGYTAQLADLVRPRLAEFGLVPVAAAGTEVETQVHRLDSLLVPGGAVGVALVDGDVSLAAIGTLTWREGNRIIAFGHPMFSAGATSLPMTGGKIHTVMPSLATSFKLFSPSRPVGTITQDRLTGIAGTIGPVPEMIPVRVAVNSPATKHVYSCRVVDHPALAADMVAIALAEVLFSTEGALEDMTLRSEMRITVEDTLTVVVRHYLAEEGPAARFYERVSHELDAVFQNRLRKLAVTGIEFKLDFIPGQSRSRLVSCRTDRMVVRPGETVTLSITTEDRLGRAEVRSEKFQVPLATPSGKLTVVVGTRDSIQYRESMRAPGAHEPRTLSGLWRLLESSGPENELVIAGYVSSTGFTVGDRELPAPPPSLRRVIATTAEGQPVQTTSSSKVFERSTMLDQMVLGTAELTLEVRR